MSYISANTVFNVEKDKANKQNKAAVLRTLESGFIVHSLPWIYNL